MMNHCLDTEVTIDASPERVWDILTDLASYESWNPFVTSSKGHVAVGQRLVNRLQPPGGKARTFKPMVTAVEPAKIFEWRGRLGVPGIFDGRHRFEMEPTAGGGTRLVHREFFTGVLVPFVRTMLDNKTRRGFELMNDALKARAESSAGAES